MDSMDREFKRFVQEEEDVERRMEGEVEELEKVKDVREKWRELLGAHQDLHTGMSVEGLCAFAEDREKMGEPIGGLEELKGELEWVMEQYELVNPGWLMSELWAFLGERQKEIEEHIDEEVSK